MIYDINMDTIILDPNPILRAKNERVKLPLSKEDETTILKMLQYVRDSKDDEIAEQNNLQAAVGIAAPQIGINKQMFVISVKESDDEDDVLKEFALINPKIIAHSEKKVALYGGEACLSIRKEYEGYVPRYQRVRIKAFDYLQNKEVTIQFTNYLGVVVQHEYDHLQGILFYDRINPVLPWDDMDLTIIE